MKIKELENKKPNEIAVIKIQLQKNCVPIVRGKGAFERHTRSQIFLTLCMNTYLQSSRLFFPCVYC